MIGQARGNACRHKSDMAGHPKKHSRRAVARGIAARNPGAPKEKAPSDCSLGALSPGGNGGIRTSDEQYLSVFQRSFAPEPLRSSTLKFARLGSLLGSAWACSTRDSTGRCSTITATGRKSAGRKKRPRIYYAEAHEALMWDSRKVDISCTSSARFLIGPKTSIDAIVSVKGGISPPAKTSLSLGIDPA